MTYKVVTLSYTETASMVIKATDNDEAEKIVWEEFYKIPDLRIVSIEEASPEIVADIRASVEDDGHISDEERKFLN